MNKYQISVLSQEASIFINKLMLYHKILRDSIIFEALEYQYDTINVVLHKEQKID